MPALWPCRLEADGALRETSPDKRILRQISTDRTEGGKLACRCMNFMAVDRTV